MYLMVDFDKVCRVCLEKNVENLQPLSKYKHFFFISTLIEKCDENIKELTNLPYNICKECLEGLQASEDFKNKCDISNKYLLGKVRQDESLNSNLEHKENILNSENKDILNLQVTCSEFTNEKECSRTEIQIINNEPIIDRNKDFVSFEEGITSIPHFKQEIYPFVVQSSVLEETNVLDGSITKQLKQLIVSDEETNELSLKCNDKICTVCKYVAPYPSALTMHMKSHLKDHSFKCPHRPCKKIYKNTKQLKKHVLIHNTTNKYTCNKCEENFIFRSGLINHLATHEREKFECGTCLKIFTSEFELHSHSKRHNVEGKQFICDICNKVKYSKYYLDVHMRGHALQQNIFKCDKCTFRTISFASMKIHERLHSGEKPVLCVDCGEGFISLLHMRQHFMKVHEIKIEIEETLN